MDNVFFTPARSLALAEIINITEAAPSAEVRGDLVIRNVAPIERATSEDITFINSRNLLPLLNKTKSKVLFCNASLAAKIPDTILALIVPDPQSAFTKILHVLYPYACGASRCDNTLNISDTAHIDASAKLEDGVIIEPGAVIGAGVSIGKGTVICAQAVIARNCQIGRNCSIGSGASIANTLMGDDVTVHSGSRLGHEGFGYVSDKNGHHKIPQIGRLIIQDCVDIGTNTTIDRGAMGDTVIGEGTKIDNLVQIGHNVKTGRHCIIVSQVGIAGSTILGDFVVLGGAVGVNGHIKIGDGAQIAAKSAIVSDVPPNVSWGGIPARPIKAFLRDMADMNARAFGRKKLKKEEGSHE